MADGTLRIVYTGALTPTYELDVVLRAVAAIGRRRPGLPVRATFYGRGDALPALEALAAELGIADRVELPGPNTRSRTYPAPWPTATSAWHPPGWTRSRA